MFFVYCVALMLVAADLCVLSCLLAYRCVWWFLSGIVITPLGKSELVP